MNKIYKLVWSTRAQGYVVASEATPSKGRSGGEARAIAALTAGLVSVLGSGGASAAPCTDIVVSANTSSSVVVSCPVNVSVTASLEVPGATALTNTSGSISGDLMSLTIGTTGIVSGQNAVALSSATVTGDITNNGLINSYWSGGGSGFGGPGLSLNDMVVNGTISNTGTIQGGYSGIELSSSSADLLKNSGTITSGGIGLDFGAATIGELRNEAAGQIHGNNQGMRINSGTTIELLNNSGTISSFGDAIAIFNNSQVDDIDNHVGALISGSGHGILVDGSGRVGNVTNAGRIEGGEAGIQTYYGTVTGTITNQATGTIQGNEAGIQLMLESRINAIINEGTISGGPVGIDGHEGSVISDGIANSGTISGSNYAIYIENDNYSSLDRIDLVGTQAALIGDVEATTANVNVKSGAEFTTTNAFNVRSFTVESGATLNLTNALHTASGLGVDGISVSQGFFNNGTVAISASTLGRVTGNYTQAAGSTLSVGVDSLANHGVLAVSSMATLADGSTLKVNVGGNASFSAGDRVAGVVTAGDTLTVNTAGGLTVQDNSVLYKFTADTSRAASELDLLVSPDEAPFVNNVGAGRTPLLGVAQTLDKILADGVPAGLQPVMDRLTSLTTEQAQEAMQQLLPVMTGAGSQAGVSALRSMNKIIQSRVESNQGLSSGNPASERYLWVRAFGSAGEQDSQDVVAGFRSQTGGIVIGGDKPINDKLRAGFAFTYARTDIDSRGSGAPSSLDVNTYELVHYGSYNLDPVTDINYQVDAGYNTVKGVRQILFLGQQAHSDFDSLNLHASVGIGRTWALSSQSSMTPSVRVDYTHMKTGDYTETGASGVNLQVDDSTFKEFMVTADIKGSHHLTERTKLVGNVSAGYDLINKQSVTTSSFVGGGSVFETRGLDSSPWLYRAGLGLLHDHNDMEYSLRYDLERRTSGYTNQTLSARVRWAF